MVTNRASESADQAEGTRQKKTKINGARSRVIRAAGRSQIPIFSGSSSEALSSHRLLNLAMRGEGWFAIRCGFRACLELSDNRLPARSLLRTADAGLENAHHRSFAHLR